jgi:hypothetical protein
MTDVSALVVDVQRAVKGRSEPPLRSGSRSASGRPCDSARDADRIAVKDPADRARPAMRWPTRDRLRSEALRSGEGGAGPWSTRAVTGPASESYGLDARTDPSP